MLVVLLVLMVATSAAMLALHTATSELQASGYERVAVQTHGVADAAIVTTVAWIDLLGSTGQWLKTWRTWRDGGPPDMGAYPEPEINPAINQGQATRVTMEAQRSLHLTQANEVGVVCNTPAAAGTGGGGGGGGSGGAGGASSNYGCESSFDTGNLTGSFGPTQGYTLPAGTGYVVDVTDCLVAPASLLAGEPAGGTSPYDIVSFICIVTARGRLEIGSDQRTWDYGGVPGYTQRVFASAHDGRAVVLTPQMIVPKNSNPGSW